jgi:hypothetical protein
MELLKADDDPHGTGLRSRMVSENGLVEMGIYPVLFGSRIRAGFVGEPTCVIDWCCGDSQARLNSHYAAIFLYLKRREEDHSCFDGLPKTSDIKPCWLDEEFEKRLTKAMLTTAGTGTKEAMN